MSLVARCTLSFAPEQLKVRRTKYPRSPTLSASRVNGLRPQKLLYQVDQRLHRSAQVESRMPLLIRSISFPQPLWRVAIQQRGVKDRVDSTDSSRVMSKLLAEGTIRRCSAKVLKVWFCASAA